MRYLISLVVSLLVLAAMTQIGYTFRSDGNEDGSVAATHHLIGMLDTEQTNAMMLPVDSPKQVGWHFIPKDARKGLELNKMTETQRAATHKLLESLLSESGYQKTTRIMGLEKLLKELKTKNGGSGPIRDPLRYYLTLFGSPTEGRWGVSFEGHHLSLNFVLEGDRVVSSTPQFFATNPATVRSENSVGVDIGTRVLRLEETLAFELVNTLSKKQCEKAIVAKQAPREIRGAGSAQPPQEQAIGISIKDLSSEQRKLLRLLINEYVSAVPDEVADQRNAAMREAGFTKIWFAWAGSKVPGIGHYYRIQGPTFLIEFVNTQPDADGNPANHIHCVWRNMRGDFGKPIGV